MKGLDESNMALGKKQRWLILTGYVLLIYATIPVVRPLVDFFVKNAGLQIKPAVNVLFAITGAYLVFALIFKYKVTSLACYIWLACLGCIYVYLLSAIKIPIERIHLLEYGLLSFFAYMAFRESFGKLKSYLFSFILTAILGWIDEGIQALVPGRYYDIKDVGLNALSGLLALFVAYFVMERGARPK